MKKIFAIHIFLLTFALHAIGVGNTYVDEVGSIFKEDCSIIADQAIRDTVIDISNLYEDMTHSSDPKCSPQAVAPDLNNLMRGPVCDFLGSQKANYDFCRPRPTDPDAAIPLDLNPYVEELPWAKTIGALVSYTEIMIRNECFSKLAGNGQNFGQVMSNILGVVQNLSMATSSIEPTMASVAMGSRLGMILFSTIGAIAQAIEEHNRSVNPIIFSTKMCGLRKYLLNRQRAKCLTGCATALEEANKQLDCSICTVNPSKDVFDSVSGTYQNYSNLLSNLADFKLTSSNQLINPEQKKTVDAMVSTIKQDRNLIAKKLGYDSTAEFTDKYFDITDQNDPRFAWLDYEKPSTTVNKQKDEINLIMGLPGLIIKDHLCDDPERQLHQDSYFQEYLKFNDSETDKLCDTMNLYYKCAAENGWRDSSNTSCYEERAKLDDPNYSPMKFIKTSKIKGFMNAIQMQKLTQEVKSNNSACFTINHCEQNKYNCMALLNTFDGVNNCGALSNLTADSRQLKYLDKVKEKGYVDFHRLYLQQQLDGITNSSDYQNYLNLTFAQKELGTLISTVTSQKEFDKCMEGKREHERKDDCLEQYNNMKDVAMNTINECVFSAPSEGYSGKDVNIQNMSWDDFFKSSAADGNLKSTVKRVLAARRDPWEKNRTNNDGKKKPQEALTGTALNLCRTLYCPLKKLNTEVIGFNLFDLRTWFGGDNPPLIRHSKDIRNSIVKRCPKLFEKEFEKIESPSADQSNRYQSSLNCPRLECGAIVEKVLQSYKGPFGSQLDLDQCLEPDYTK